MKKIKRVLIFLIVAFINLEIVNAKELTIHAIECDVWGDATLLESNGEYLLMDTCDKGEQNKVLSYLDKNNVTNLDLYLTHYNEDHFAKIMDILNSDKYHVNNIYLPTFKVDNNIADKILAKASEDDINIIYPKLGDNISLGTANIEIIGPQPGAEESSSPRNDNSLVAKIQVGNKSAIISGDIEKLQEQLLVKSDVDLKADILKLGHHGMDTSNTDEFIEAVNPTYAFYSYYSTSEESSFAKDTTIRNVVNRVMKISNVLSTEYNGNLKYKLTDNNITVSAERNYLEAKIHYIDMESNEEIATEVLPFNANTYLHLADREFANYVKVDNKENKIKTLANISDNLVDKSQDINVYYQKIAAEQEVLNSEVPTTNSKICTALNNKYYDDNGNETTLENFKKVCKTVENPQTGAIISIGFIILSIIIILMVLPIYNKNILKRLK